jgi:hypothetical protein
VAGLSTVSLGYKYFEEAPKLKQMVYSELPEFQAEVKDGQLQVTGIEQPYIKSFENFAIVVDTVATGTLDIKSFVKQDTQSVLLVTKDNFEVYDGQSKTIKKQSVKEFNNSKTDRADVLKIADSAFSNKIIWMVIIFCFVILFIFFVVSNLLNVLFISYLFYSITKYKKLGWKFKEVFTVGLFTVTLPLILTQAAPSFYLNWVFMLVFAGWMYLVVIKKDKVVKE